MDLKKKEYSAPRTIEKIRILGAILDLPANQHCQFGPFTKKSGKMCLISSAVQLVAPERPPGFCFLKTAMGAKPTFYMKFIATYAPQKVDIIIHSQAVCLIQHLKLYSPSALRVTFQFSLRIRKYGRSIDIQMQLQKYFYPIVLYVTPPMKCSYGIHRDFLYIHSTYIALGTLTLFVFT